ncbi:hypothetical protein WR25_11043 [Diploscapter pachys]|uniref:Uncharacterized protein n=1 Tax=Diploscapter pachys TaxID=2018661 RepID=A0A2A2LTM1_9BILA|nr:hypothetical protein WR25_11043 [Diploscapter pachys]
MELKTTICLLLIFVALFLLLPWIVYNEESGPEQEGLEFKFERELKAMADRSRLARMVYLMYQESLNDSSIDTAAANLLTHLKTYYPTQRDLELAGNYNTYWTYHNSIYRAIEQSLHITYDLPIQEFSLIGVISTFVYRIVGFAVLAIFTVGAASKEQGWDRLNSFRYVVSIWISNAKFDEFLPSAVVKCNISLWQSTVYLSRYIALFSAFALLLYSLVAFFSRFSSLIFAKTKKMEEIGVEPTNPLIYKKKNN